MKELGLNETGEAEAEVAVTNDAADLEAPSSSTATELAADSTTTTAAAAASSSPPINQQPTSLRTTLMMKNIPNKYTRAMILELLNRHEELQHTFDFFYLPIDFRNRCNLGYAFINFVHPFHAIRFYKLFQQRKWDFFNSSGV